MEGCKIFSCRLALETMNTKDQPRSYIGFRTVHDYLGADLTANAMTNTATTKRNNQEKFY